MSYEIEQKFRISNPATIRQRLKKLNAKKISSGEEFNELFDQGCVLRKQKSVLRLRRFDKGKGLLTFKGPRLKGRYKKRLEIETRVDYAAARKMLLLLGYKPVAIYAKYREEYAIRGAHVTLDRLRSIGWFVEIEGSIKQIGVLTGLLGFKRSQQEHRTYLEILHKVRA